MLSREIAGRTRVDLGWLVGAASSGWVVRAETLPFRSYVCSLFITFPVSSDGGHWAVQGPFVIPAAYSSAPPRPEPRWPWP